MEEEIKETVPAPPMKQRIILAACLFIWSIVCIIGGAIVGTALPGDTPSPKVEQATDPYTLSLAVALEESRWKYDSLTVDFADGVMALAAKGGAAEAAATGDGAVPSGTLVVEKYLGGDPQPGARFAIYRESGELCADLSTDGSGKTRVILGAGNYSICEKATSENTIPVEEYPFTITRGGELTLMLSSLRLCSIRVLSTPGSEILIYTGTNRNKAPLYRNTVGEDGSLTIPNLSPGEYTLCAGDLTKRVVAYGGETVSVQLSDQ